MFDKLQTTPEWTPLARKIAAQFVPPTISVQNIDLIAKALKEAHDAGWNRRGNVERN